MEQYAVVMLADHVIAGNSSVSDVRVVVVCLCEQRDLMNKKRQRNPHTLVLPNEDKTASGRLSPRGDAKPLMRPAHNVTQVVSPYCQ